MGRKIIKNIVSLAQITWKSYAMAKPLVTPGMAQWDQVVISNARSELFTNKILPAELYQWSYLFVVSTCWKEPPIHAFQVHQTQSGNVEVVSDNTKWTWWGWPHVWSLWNLHIRSLRESPEITKYLRWIVFLIRASIHFTCDSPYFP